MATWLPDFAAPTTILTSAPPLDRGYVSALLVIIKAETDDTAITTLLEPTADSDLMFLNAAFNAGMSKVSYIKRATLDLTTFDLKTNWFNIVFKGFSDSEVLAANLGEFKGVKYVPTEAPDTTIKTNYGYVNDLAGANNGYTTVYTAALILSQTQFRNMQYTSTTETTLTTVNAGGAAQQWYEGKNITWGVDDTLGTVLVTPFIGGEGVSKPYIMELIKIDGQEQTFNYIQIVNPVTLQNPDDSMASALALQRAIRQTVDTKYVVTGLITDYSLTIRPSTTPGEFVMALDLAVPYPLFKNIITIQG